MAASAPLMSYGSHQEGQEPGGLDVEQQLGGILVANQTQSNHLTKNSVRVLYGYDSHDVPSVKNRGRVLVETSQVQHPSPVEQVNSLYETVYSSVFTVLSVTMGVVMAIVYGVLMALFDAFWLYFFGPAFQYMASVFRFFSTLMAHACRPLAALMCPWNKN